MPRTIIYLSLCILLVGSSLASNEVAVSVNAGDLKGDISPMLTGTNTSWYYDRDDIWSDGSMACYLRKLATGVLRYPGGCETSIFHWEYPYDIGTPCGEWAVDLWDPLIDPESYPQDILFMDTDDYVKQCRIVKAEPMIGVNIHSGIKYGRVQDSIDEAVRWVEYCKIKNYDVKYWYIDNEVYYHSDPAVTVAEFADYINQWVPAMKAVDPDIKIVAGWENKLSLSNYWADWEYLIENAGANFDIADLHWYWAWAYATWELWLGDNPMKVREWCGDCPDQRYIGPSFADEIKGFYDKIKDINGTGYDIKLAALEWNIGPVQDGRFSRFQHALMQSEMLQQFIEGGLYMACIWPLTWSGGLYGDFRTVLDQEVHKPAPTLEVFKLYSEILGEKLITSQSDMTNVPSLAAISQDGETLWVYLIHKSNPGENIKATVLLGDFAAVRAEGVSLTARELSSDIAGINKLRVTSAGAGQWQTNLPSYSLTMLKFSK